jgi:hypothetical protein
VNLSFNMSIDTDPQQQEAASPQVLVVRSSSRYVSQPIMRMLADPKSTWLALLPIVLALSDTASAQLAQPQGLAFPVSQLSGWWAESYSTKPACDPSNVRTRQVFAPDGKRLQFVFDRPWQTELGMKSHSWATIISSTERTLVIRYDDETRRKQSGQPIEWELSMAAPGVYRWRETDWKQDRVNTVVGIRCVDK